MLHRLQEGISYGDGVEYTVSEYLQTASRRTQEWKAKYYPDHDLLARHKQALEEKQQQQQQAQASVPPETPVSSSSTGGTGETPLTSSTAHHQKMFLPENLERDFWDIVEAHTRQVTVEYGNDVDTATFGSAFPLSRRGRSVKRPSPEAGSDGTPSTPSTTDEEADDEDYEEEEEENKTGKTEPEFGTPECKWNMGISILLLRGARCLSFPIFLPFSRLSRNLLESQQYSKCPWLVSIVLPLWPFMHCRSCSHCVFVVTFAVTACFVMSKSALMESTSLGCTTVPYLPPLPTTMKTIICIPSTITIGGHPNNGTGFPEIELPPMASRLSLRAISP